MPSFGRREEQGDALAAASLASIEAGGLPIAAQRRLDDLRNRPGTFFTSDLSVNEFVLVKEAGFQPVTQVMGSCFYHLGYQWMPAWQSAPAYWTDAGGNLAYGGASARSGETVELETASEAWNEARRLALGRLSEEASRAGADAVVGVRIERGAYDWAAGLIEFVVTGTAVVSDRYALPNDGGGPLLSNLSGQDFANLFHHGWCPVGLVAGSTVCYVMTGWGQRNTMGTGLLTSWQNQELPDFTRGMYDARTQAMLRVSRQAHELGAHGIVGVRMEHDEHERETDRGGTKFRDLVVTMHVLGTAIVELAGREDPPPVYTALRLDREDG
ncbi:MAG: hypothetical protein QOH16_2421 [Gaiellaceae bacterium]|nr:hypothetical protein [Gaiellaceae bacterium]